MKRYLKTKEEVTQALREGKTVQTNEMEYGIINNLIVGFDKIVREIYINPAIRLSEKPYIAESKPLKLEVGKFYKTRAGKKVIITFIDEYNKKENKPIYITVLGEITHYWAYPNGSYLLSCKDAYDLVAPWEEQ